MTCIISNDLITQLEKHLEKAYPEEGAGILIGKQLEDGNRQITQLILLDNNWSEGSRADRFFITPQDVLAAEEKADAEGLVLLGVFHSHPDDLNRPSEFDRSWALPWFSYIITTVSQGQATSHRLWELSDDRSKFIEKKLLQQNVQL